MQTQFIARQSWQWKQSVEESRFWQAVCKVFDPVLRWNKACIHWPTSSLDKYWTPVWVGVCACKREGDHTCFSLQEKYGVKVNFDLSNWQFAAWRTVCTCLQVLVCARVCVWVWVTEHARVYSIMTVGERESNASRIFSWCVFALKKPIISIAFPAESETFCFRNHKNSIFHQTLFYFFLR